MQLSLFSSSSYSDRIIEIQERLCATYGCPIAYFHDLDPLSELISALLSHRTKNADSHQAFQQLTAKFPTWEDVRDAPTSEVEGAIVSATWAEMKALRIQMVLHQITEQRDGELCLNFLADLSILEARVWLERLPGVGAKTSAAALAFSNLRRPVLVVDSHHHRVATRLALIPAHTSLQSAHILLENQIPESWTAQQIYDNHEVMMLHGQKCCYYRKPNCEQCILIDCCPSRQNQFQQ